MEWVCQLASWYRRQELLTHRKSYSWAYAPAWNTFGGALFFAWPGYRLHRDPQKPRWCCSFWWLEWFYKYCGDAYADSPNKGTNEDALALAEPSRCIRNPQLDPRNGLYHFCSLCSGCCTVWSNAIFTGGAVNGTSEGYQIGEWYVLLNHHMVVFEAQVLLHKYDKPVACPGWKLTNTLSFKGAEMTKKFCTRPAKSVLCWISMFASPHPPCGLWM